MTDQFLQVTPDLQEKEIIESTMHLITDTVKRHLATARSFIKHTVYNYLETGTLNLLHIIIIVSTFNVGYLFLSSWILLYNKQNR